MKKINLEIVVPDVLSLDDIIEFMKGSIDGYSFPVSLYNKKYKIESIIGDNYHQIGIIVNEQD